MQEVRQVIPQDVRQLVPVHVAPVPQPVLHEVIAQPVQLQPVIEPMPTPVYEPVYEHWPAPYRLEVLFTLAMPHAEVAMCFVSNLQKPFGVSPAQLR